MRSEFRRGREGEMERLVFARIAWHARYNGEDPPPHTRANWEGKKRRRYGEVLNFSGYKGMYYGYANPSRHGTANLGRIGAPAGAESRRGITVIWVAPDPNGGTKIVGWYRNATMYSELQRRPKPLLNKYLFKAKTSESFLIGESHRTFLIKKRFHHLWYAEKEKNLKAKVLDYIESYPKLNSHSASGSLKNRI